MATSGTTVFDLDIIDVIEEAYEQVGVESRNGYDMRTARRSLNLLTKEWANRGINFWTIKESTKSFAASVNSGAIDSDAIDILDAVWRTGSGTSQIDRPLTRIGVSEWAGTANKNQTGQPSTFWVNRIDPAVVTIWPVPVDAGTLVYWKMRRLEDTGDYTNNMDVPTRFLPALVSGLAYYLSMKTPAAEAKIPRIQAEYERQFDLAATEDRERASLHLVPAIGSI